MSASPGAAETQITTDFGAQTPSFTPDGKILFGQVDTNSIYVMNVDGSDVRPLTNSDGTTSDESPSASQDGETVVFSRSITSGGSGVDIWRVGIDGTHLKQLTTDGLSFDPIFVSNKVVFISTRDQFTAWVYAMNPDGSGQRRLARAWEYFEW